MNNINKSIIILFSVFFLTGKIFATTHYVSKTGNHIPPFSTLANAATDIQSAVYVATAGSLVLINDGTYYPDSCIYVTNNITVKSINGKENTIIDGNDSNTNESGCFYIYSGNTIDDLTITRGFYGSAGGVCCAFGGTVQNCLISENTALRGGGILCGGDALIKDCIIIRNSATWYNGGGVRFYNGGTVQDCIITGNYSDTHGGGVYCYNNNTVLNCIINENTADYSGGGLYCHNDATIQNCTINKNSALDGSGYGGGVKCTGGNLINCIINKNSASFIGGGVNFDDSIIQNCTIINNSASFNNSGGIYCDNGGAGTVQNCILWNNNNGNTFDEKTINRYNCIENWASHTNGIITSNPNFRDAISGDYRLESFSPCCDAGTNMSWMWTSTDLDGNPRITAGIVDMGAYEYIPEPVLFINFYLLFIIFCLRKK